MAAVISDNGIESGRDIPLRCRDGRFQRIPGWHSSYDALSYPLIFPRGEAGWKIGLRYNNDAAKNKLTLRDWCAYYLPKRDPENISLLSGRLFQQFIVDQYAKIEEERLLYIRHNQATLSPGLSKMEP